MEFKTEMITIKVRLVETVIPRQVIDLRKFVDYHDLIWEHCVDPKSENGHAITIARDKEGLQIFLCCIGSFLVKREEIPDPYLLDVQDGKELLTGLCENFQRMKDIQPSSTQNLANHNV